MPYFIAIDIDRTLLSKGELVAANKEAIDEARAHGAIVVLATARSYLGALPIHQALGLDTPMVVSNGSMVCLPNGTVIHQKAISTDLAQETFELYSQTDYFWSVRVGQLAYVHPNFPCETKPFTDQRYYLPSPLTSVQSYLRDAEDVLSLTLFGDAGLEDFYKLHNWHGMGYKHSFYTPGSFNPRYTMSVISNQANKGSGVEWLRQHLGASTLPTLLLGDALDDVSMFHLGTSVAPAASEPEALDAADWVGPDASQGVVAAAMERYVFPELQVVIE